MEFSQTFKSEKHLSDWVKRSARYAIWENLFGVFLSSLILLSIVHGAANLGLAAFGIIGIMAITFAYLYVGIVRRSRVLNHTVAQIRIQGSEIHLETYGIRMFGFPISPKNVSAGRDQIRITEGKYPMLDGKNLDSKCFKLVFRKDKYYILKSYFDSDLIDALST